MPKNIVPLLAPESEGRKLTRQLCRKHKIKIAEFEELVQAEVEQIGKLRKRGLSDQFDDILDRMADED
jgi:hypothetical protein